MGQQVHDQLLVGLAGGEDAHVRKRRGRQQSAQQVERLCVDGARVGAPRLAVGRREGALRPRAHARQRCGVDREQVVHGGLVLGSQLVIAVVAVAARGIGQRGVVGDIAGRLLEVGGEPGPLEDLGEHVGDPLAGQVGAPELGDRVIAVAKEHTVIERGGALALAGFPGLAGRRQILGEFLEEEPTQRARVSGVAGEEGALDGLGQVHQAEDRPVEVREVRRKEPALGFGEALDRVLHSGRPIVAVPAVVAAGRFEAPACDDGLSPARARRPRAPVRARDRRPHPAWRSIPRLRC